MAWPALLPGRLLQADGDVGRRGMTVHDKTRLIGQLPPINKPLLKKFNIFGVFG